MLKNQGFLKDYGLREIENYGEDTQIFVKFGRAAYLNAFQ